MASAGGAGDLPRGPGRPGRQRAAGVMGSPIAHTLSPVIHRAAYRSLGLDWTYDAREVDETGLAAALAGLDEQWVGVSLTMPLKQAVIPLLDQVSDLAIAVGAVNTVTFGPAGRSGDNTDVHGIVAALTAAGVRTVTEPVVLGGGATAASALAALRELGAAEVRVVVRSAERAAVVLAAGDRLAVRPRLVPWASAADELGRAAVVLSTVPAGAADSVLPPGATVAGVLLDVVYRPWPTRLASAWSAGGGSVVPGLEMLLHQAAAQVYGWAGDWPDLSQMRQAATAATG